MRWVTSKTADQAALAHTIAFVAHKPQTRKGEPPEPYFRHVERVAAGFLLGPERCVAYLHDVVEDTAMGFTDLVMLGVDEEVVRAVELLTHAHGIDHETYVAGIRRIDAASRHTDAGRWARAVKLADLADNAGAVPRLQAAGQHKLAARLDARYRAALSVLSACELV